MNDRTARCVICQHETHTGRLCAPHYERLGAMLRDIEAETAMLNATPSMQQRYDSGGGGLASERAPARLDVLVHTDRRRGRGDTETDDDRHAAGHTLPTLEVLTHWANLVREERNYADRTARTLMSERDLLTRNLEHAANAEWAATMYGELRTLLAQLRAANGTRPDKPVGICPLPTPDGICGGHIWTLDQTQPVWRRHPDRCTRTWETAPGPDRCDTCNATWTTPADKARLNRMVNDAAQEHARPRTDDGRPMLTAHELVNQGHATSVSNVRVTAHRRGHSAIRGHYDPHLIARHAAV